MEDRSVSQPPTGFSPTRRRPTPPQRRRAVSRRITNLYDEILHPALGLLDFVVAFGAGNYVNLHPEIYGGHASMSALPLVIVPAFFVPAFSLIHLAAWLAGPRRWRRPAGPEVGPGATCAAPGPAPARRPRPGRA